MSAPTEMELNRPDPDAWGWECSVAGCREPVPADVEDQPHCEACHMPVCAAHVVTRCHVHLCPVCVRKQRETLNRIAEEMKSIWARNEYCLMGPDVDLNDIQATCERWVKEIGEVL